MAKGFRKKVKKNTGEGRAALGLIVLVIVLTCLLLFAAVNYLQGRAVKNEGQEIGEEAGAFLDEQLRYATALEITDDIEVDSYENSIQVQDGHLLTWSTSSPGDKNEVFSSDFYNETSLKVEATLSNDSILVIRIYVYNEKGEELYCQENTYDIINLDLAREEQENNSNDNLPPQSLAVTVGGNLAQDTVWSNPVFCFSYETKIDRENYYPPPRAMYDQSVAALELLKDDTALSREYGSSAGVSNEAVRAYVRLNYYGGDWPQASEFIDLAAVSQSTDMAGVKPLSQRNISIQPYIDVDNGSVVIVGRDYGDGNGNADIWNDYVLVFVPSYYSLTAVDMSAGTWYTYLPTLEHPQWYNYPSLDGLTEDNKDIVEFYDTVKENWHPVDGQDCICKYCRDQQ